MSQDKTMDKITDKEHKVMEENTVIRAQEIFASLQERVGSHLSAPLQTWDEKGVHTMKWESHRYLIQIEVNPDLSFDWFFRDREGDELDGTDKVTEKNVTRRMVHRFKQLFPAPKVK
jgi:hypothetical protein